MKYTALLSLLFLACSNTPKDFGTIPQVSSMHIDGQQEDWENIPSLYLSSSDSTITEGRGTFTENSLNLAIQTAWDENALYIAATWQDDVLDVIDIPLDSVIWSGHPDGLRRDKMYYFDNLAVRLRLPNYFAYWLSPNLNTQGFQHAENISPSTAIQQLDTRTFFIESKVRWNSMGFSPSVGDTISLQIIAPDSDDPSLSLLEKNPSTKYLLWRGDVVLGSR